MVRGEICSLCRGSKHLCGLTYCPLLVKFYSRVSVRLVELSDLVKGSSPPSVFVGRVGYPKVNVGPSLPPQTGDTREYELPESWIGRSLEDILVKRLSMVVGVSQVSVRDVESSYVSKIQELALSEKSVDVEVLLDKKYFRRPVFGEEILPFGPRALLRDLRVVSNPYFGRPVEKVFSDTDLRAVDAVLLLYSEGLPVSRIQRIFSVGALGRPLDRKLVPTRWSITAVDNIISKSLVRRVRELPELSEILVYVRKYMQNLFVAVLLPGVWSYEWVEAWFPGSTWNPSGTRVAIGGDHEGPMGKFEYALTGGCYYAARLGVAEHLLYRLGRQATVFLYREIYEGFNAPVGVWFVRENIRKLFESRPAKFSELNEVLSFLREHTRVDVREIRRNSNILRNYGKVRTLDYFWGKRV
ncbi:MAG: Nre family DNA repair protein [Desulfurococcaceae archaeon TW002]